MIVCCFSEEEALQLRLAAQHRADLLVSRRVELERAGSTLEAAATEEARLVVLRGLGEVRRPVVAG